METENENNDDELLDNENSLTSVSPKNSIKKRSQARIIWSVWFNKDAQPEKHYCELIMLFTPWRNEQTDLMGSFSSYQEHYIACYNEVSEQMRQYAVCSEDLNEIQNHLQECDDDLKSWSNVMSSPSFRSLSLFLMSFHNVFMTLNVIVVVTNNKLT